MQEKNLSAESIGRASRFGMAMAAFDFLRFRFSFLQFQISFFGSKENGGVALDISRDSAMMGTIRPCSSACPGCWAFVVSWGVRA